MALFAHRNSPTQTIPTCSVFPPRFALKSISLTRPRACRSKCVHPDPPVPLLGPPLSDLRQWQCECLYALRFNRIENRSALRARRPSSRAEDSDRAMRTKSSPYSKMERRGIRTDPVCSAEAKQRRCVSAPEGRRPCDVRLAGCACCSGLRPRCARSQGMASRRSRTIASEAAITQTSSDQAFGISPEAKARIHLMTQAARLSPYPFGTPARSEAG